MGHGTRNIILCRYYTKHGHIEEKNTKTNTKIFRKSDDIWVVLGLDTIQSSGQVKYTPPQEQQQKHHQPGQSNDIYIFRSFELFYINISTHSATG